MKTVAVSRFFAVGHVSHFIRTIARHEGLTQACLARIEKAERVVPKMPAAIEFVSKYVRQQVSQLVMLQPASCAMHAHLIPSYYLERVAATQLIHQGQALRGLPSASVLPV